MNRSWFLGAAALGLVLRLSFAIGYWNGKPLTHDEREYLTLARSLAAGRGLTYGALDGAAPASQFGRAPGYPAFIAAVLLLSGQANAEPLSDVPRALKVAQSAVGAAGVLVIGLVAWRAAGVAAGRYAALAAAVYPPLVWICAYALSEALYSVIALSSAALFCLAARGASPAAFGERCIPPGGVAPRSNTVGILTRRALPGGRIARLGATPDLHHGLLGIARSVAKAPGPASLMFASGLVAGCATLVRSSMLFFLILAGVYLCWNRRFKLALLLAAGSLLVVAPWTIRNVREHGRLVLVAAEGGVTFWTGNNPLARGEGDMAANPEIARANIALLARHPGLTAEQLEPMYYREALVFIADHPLRWVVLLCRKLFYTWVPIGPSYRLHSMRYYAASLVSYGVVLPLALAGAWKLRRRGTPPRGVWLLAASSIVMCVVFFPQERFRLPIVDPTLLICAASWLALGRSGEAQNARAWT